jgi:predicted dienelactone hydrolase
MKKILLFLLLTTCALAQPTFSHLNVLGRDVALWTPDTPAPKGGFPLVLFSHGYTGCNTQSVFLMQAFAKAGYVVVAPNHRDATCGSARGTGTPMNRVALLHPQQPFHDPSKWSDATYKDRLQDMQAVLHEVLRPGSFAGVAIDPEKIGVAGHSLGGYVALGIAGGWTTWKDPRIKAVLALSAHCSPFLDHGNLAHLNVPIMYQGGTKDLGESMLVSRKDGAYDSTSSPKYYVEFKGAGHFAWSNVKSVYQSPISDYSVAFFDQYVKGDTSEVLKNLVSNPDPKLISDVRASKE